MSENKTSEAMKEMMRASLKISLSPAETIGITREKAQAFVRKYQKMEEALEVCRTAEQQTCEIASQEAIAFDPLSE